MKTIKNHNIQLFDLFFVESGCVSGCAVVSGLVRSDCPHLVQKCELSGNSVPQLLQYMLKAGVPPVRRQYHSHGCLTRGTYKASPRGHPSL